MKIGIYGGSFNPVHYGHIGLAEYVLSRCHLDEVWLMVSPNNPLKPASILADEQVRLAGVREAIVAEGERGKGLIASDFEFALPRPSYTANTLRALSEAYPEHTFSLIIGEDNWAIFPRWRESDFILQHYPLIVYPRHAASSAADVPAQEPFPPSVCYLAGAPYFDISSTEIRARKGC